MRPEHARGQQPLDLAKDRVRLQEARQPDWVSNRRKDKYGRGDFRQARSGLLDVTNSGRTVLYLKPIYSMRDVAALVEEVGFDIGWAGPAWWSASIAQRIDIVATWMVDTALAEVTSQKDKGDVLTCYKMYSRRRRETFMTIDAMDALLAHNRHLRPAFHVQTDPSRGHRSVSYDED